MRERWGRRERKRVATGLLSHALIEIRHLANNPASAGSTDEALDKIHMIADVCHNVPGAGDRLPRSIYDFDPFVYLWKTASADQRRWLTNRLEALEVNYDFLVEFGPWPPPAKAPATRPQLRRGGWRIPRSLHEYVLLDTASLRTLVLEAAALEPPGRKRPDNMLAHLDPSGHHLVRPSRPNEVSFLPHGPGDLRQYRGVLQMTDGALAIGHLRLRTSSLAALPPKLGMLKRLMLAASVSPPGERDVYLWTRDHRTHDPQCPQCTESSQSELD